MDLKSNLRAGGRPALGTFVGISSPALVEMLGHAGYDFVILDMEHGVFNPEGLEGCLRACRATNVPCVVRVADQEARSIQSALDMGADGIQVPQVETVSQASMAVQFSQYPPAGKRGWGSGTRAASYGFRSPRATRESAQRELVTAIQVESRAGVENLAAILEVGGVDVVFIGTSDLSIDYGYDSPNDAGMVPLVEGLVSAIAVAGKVPGVHISDWTRIERLRDLGVRYFTTSAPLVIRDAFARQVKDFCSKVEP